MPCSVTINNVSAEYPTAQGGLVKALDRLSFHIEPGEFVSLVGSSGCGKSTALRLVAGLIHPTAGFVYVDQERITKPSLRVGIMFQDSNLMPWRTVQDNIALPLELRGVSRTERYSQVETLLPILGLKGFATAYPGQLSGGMSQRVALGRLLIQQPDVMLLDEPFGALDALTRERLSMDLLRVWHAQNLTVLMVTHDINEAVLLSDRVIVLSHRPGHVKLDLPVPLARPRHPSDLYSEAFGTLVSQVRTALDL
ncbi:MAG: ABC transporter ATP-binding protein [Phototrophicaceae bacterium]